MKRTLGLPSVQQTLVQRLRMTRSISSGQPDQSILKMVNKKKKYFLSTNAPRKTMNNFILSTKSMRESLVLLRTLFNVLTGPTIQKLDQTGCKNQNSCICHVIMFMRTQTTQSTRDAQKTLKLRNNTLVRCMCLCILMKKFQSQINSARNRSIVFLR